MHYMIKRLFDISHLLSERVILLQSNLVLVLGDIEVTWHRRVILEESIRVLRLSTILIRREKIASPGSKS